MVTSCAPRRRASSTNGQRCTLELTMLAPQATMRRAWTTASGSKPSACRRWPCRPGGARAGADRAVEQAGAQRAGRSGGPCCRRTAGPCCRRRSRAGWPAGRGRDHVAEARRDLVQRLVPGDALEAALALPPHAPQRVEDAVGAVDAVQVLVDLRAEEALREAVVGVAADGHRPAVLDVDRHHAGVRAVVGADDLEACGAHVAAPSMVLGRSGSAAARPPPPAPPRPR